MAANQIKQLASSGGANVLTPSAYAALTALLANGFTAGIAPSIQVNTVLRQTSFVAAMLAQFIADQSGNDVNDDGNVAGLEANLVLAVNAVTTALFSANQSLLAPGRIKLPGGLILQWGSFLSNNVADVATTLPINFPSAVLATYVSGSYSPGSGVINYSSASSSLSTLTARSNGAGQGTNFLVLGK